MDDNFRDSGNGNSREGTSKEGQLVQLDVAKLQMGMYIVKLDRPWLETPFLMQGFELSNKNQRETLEKYCQYVYIRSQPTALKEQPWTALGVQTAPSISSTDRGNLIKQAGPGARAPQKKNIIRSGASHEISVSVREEHLVAGPAFHEAKLALEKVFHSAKFGQELNVDAAEEAVSSCVASMLRNPDAMIWMSRVKHEKEYTVEHCLNVCVLAIAFGRYLNFDSAELRMLGLCGFLHDVGKMRTPKLILNKHNNLTDEEFLVVKQHTIDGHKLLKEEGSVHARPAEVVLNHHERPDGKGYPRGLKGGKISEYARIIAIVDAYDAMTSERCYAEALSSVDALKEIYENRGRQFDEDYALAFMQAIGPYPPGTLVELRNGMVGIVLSGPLKFRHLPTIVILRDEKKQVIEEKTADLFLTDSGQLDKGFLIRSPLRDGEFGIKLEDYTVKPAADPVSLTKGAS